MKNIGYRNLTPLQAIGNLTIELTKFLEGWGNFQDINIEIKEKQMIITIRPTDNLEQEER